MHSRTTAGAFFASLPSGRFVCCSAYVIVEIASYIRDFAGVVCTTFASGSRSLRARRGSSCGHERTDER